MCFVIMYRLNTGLLQCRTLDDNTYFVMYIGKILKPLGDYF